MTTTPTSKRFANLQASLHHTLKCARKQIDVQELVQECFGDDQSQVFSSLLTSVLDQADSSIKTSVQHSFKEKRVEEKLIKLEAAIKRARQDELRTKVAEEKNKNATAAAVKAAKATVSPSDLLRHRMYKRMLDEKAALGEEISGIENEIAHLQSLKEQRSARVQNVMRDINQKNEQLSASAHCHFRCP